jgi:hypothetical protein
MKEPLDASSGAQLMERLDEIDSEIARLAMLCQIRILEPGAIERVLRKDASVCGTDNPIAFEKLHNMLTMHFLVRESAGVAHGDAPVSRVERHVIDRLRARFPDLAADWPPTSR